MKSLSENNYFIPCLGTESYYINLILIFIWQSWSANTGKVVDLTIIARLKCWELLLHSQLTHRYTHSWVTATLTADSPLHSLLSLRYTHSWVTATLTAESPLYSQLSHRYTHSWVTATLTAESLFCLCLKACLLAKQFARHASKTPVVWRVLW